MNDEWFILERVWELLPDAKRGVFSSVFAFLKAHSGATGLKKGKGWREKNRFGPGKKFPNTLLKEKECTQQQQ